MKLLILGFVAIIISLASEGFISISLLPRTIEIDNEISEYWTSTIRRASDAVKNEKTSSIIDQAGIQRFLGFLE
jgi:hypothetical protein